MGVGGALPNAIATMVWYRREEEGGGKGERERRERMRGGGDGKNATVDGSPIEALPGTLCATPLHPILHRALRLLGPWTPRRDVVVESVSSDFR